MKCTFFVSEYLQATECTIARVRLCASHTLVICHSYCFFPTYVLTCLQYCRMYLTPYDLTPTYENVHNKFSIKYFLNLVLVDEEDRRYFKQQEIRLYRKGEVITGSTNWFCDWFIGMEHCSRNPYFLSYQAEWIKCRHKQCCRMILKYFRAYVSQLDGYLEICNQSG